MFIKAKDLDGDEVLINLDHVERIFKRSNDEINFIFPDGGFPCKASSEQVRDDMFDRIYRLLNEKNDMERGIAQGFIHEKM